jgi:hypothetical protein
MRNATLMGFFKMILWAVGLKLFYLHPVQLNREERRCLCYLNDEIIKRGFCAI